MTNSLPLISVIVPAYNAAQYLARCMRSVQQQTYTHWELIVVNDGSTDETASILETFTQADERIRAITTVNSGVSAARNCGIEAAKGDYVAFLDADDEWECSSLEELYAMVQTTACDIAIGQCRRVREDGSEYKSCFPNDAEHWQDSDALVQSLKDHPATYSVWGKLYKRSIIGDTRFVVGRKVHEDSFFLFELFTKSPTVEVRNIYLYRYYITASSASRAAFSDKFLDILYFAERKKDIVENDHPHLCIYIPNMIVKANMALLQLLLKTNDAQYRPLEKKCIQTVVRYKKQFIPATKANKRWFFILTHRLYPIYKQLNQLK